MKMTEFFRNFLLLVCLSNTTNASATKGEFTLAFGYENYDFREIIAAFEKQTGIRIKAATFGNDQLKVELLQRANTATLPDAVIVPADFLGLKELAFSEVPREFQDRNLAESSLKAVTVNNMQKGMPVIAGNHLLLYYNKSLTPKPADSWQKLAVQQTAFKEKWGKSKELIGWSYNEMYWFVPFLGAFEGHPFAQNQITLDTQAMHSAMQFYRELADSGITNRNCDYSCAQDMFKTGKLAYTINGVWSLGQYEEVLGDDLGVTLLPKVNGKDLKPFYSVHALAFPQKSLSSAKAAALEKFGRFIQSYKIQKLMWESFTSLPVNESLMSELMKDADADLKAVLAQLKEATPMPIAYEMSIIWEAMLKGNQRYWADILTLEEASRYMQYIATKSAEQAN